jgi:hypothetical protein
VELACIDELHNLNLATRAGADVSDQLKYFAERLPATFVYAGIEVEAQGLFAGVRGRQIAGRFTVIPAAPFAYGTTEQREQWRALIATLETLLRLHQHRPGSLTGLAEYLYQRSGGMIGSLSQLIRGAAILAIEDGTEQITRDLLDIVPVDYAAERGHATRPAAGEPAWAAWRHQPQPRCPRCDARHDGGPVTRLLPHHHYVCSRHGYWIGPPDAGQPATPLGPELGTVARPSGSTSACSAATAPPLSAAEDVLVRLDFRH